MLLIIRQWRSSPYPSCWSCSTTSFSPFSSSSLSFVSLQRLPRTYRLWWWPSWWWWWSLVFIAHLYLEIFQHQRHLQGGGSEEVGTGGDAGVQVWPKNVWPWFWKSLVNFWTWNRLTIKHPEISIVSPHFQKLNNYKTVAKLTSQGELIGWFSDWEEFVFRFEMSRLAADQISADIDVWV